MNFNRGIKRVSASLLAALRLRNLLGVLLTFTVLSFSGTTVAVAKPAIPTDKAAHFGVAAAAQTSCSSVGRMVTGKKWLSGITCFLLVNSIGVVKEATDPQNGGDRDEKDIYANLAGSGLSFLTINFAF